MFEVKKLKKGRPRVGEKSERHHLTIHICLSESQKRALVTIARNQKAKISDVARTLIDCGLDKAA